MYTVTEAFKTAMESNIKSLTSLIKYKNNDEVYVSLTDSDALVSIKLSAEGELGSSSMRKIEVEFVKTELPDSFYDVLVDEYFGFLWGVEISDGIYNYVGVGNFKIVEIKNTEDSDTITWIGYDKMYDTMIPYEDVAPDKTYWNTPPTLAQYLTYLLNIVDIGLGNSDFVLNDFVVNSDRFVSWVKNPKSADGEDIVSNIYGYTLRSLINDICKISGTTAIISNDDKLYFRVLNPINSIYTIPDITSLISYKSTDKYGAVDNVIIAREPQGDYLEKSTDDADEDTTDWKIDNNQLIDYQPLLQPDRLNYNPNILESDTNVPPTPPEDHREDVLLTIFHAICDNPLYYYPFEAETIGYGWFEIGDKVTIGDKDSLILNYSVTFDGGITEKLSARKTNKTDTKSKFKTNKAQNQTQLVVDKQNQAITGYIQKTLNDLSVEVSQVTQTSNSFQLSFSKKNGNNLIKNSVMFNFDLLDNIQTPKFWTVSGLGELNIFNIGYDNSVSGNAFELSNKKVSQIVACPKLTDINYCTFSFYYKKTVGTASYTIDYGYYSKEVLLPAGEITNYKFEKFYLPIVPNGNNITITFDAVDFQSYLVCTDVILCVGDEQAWTQAIDEVNTGTVSMTSQGLTVRGNGNLETVLSDTSLIGRVKNSSNKLFQMDYSGTRVSQLTASGHISMPPIRIENTGDGWAFVSIPQVDIWQI